MFKKSLKVFKNEKVKKKKSEKPNSESCITDCSKKCKQRWKRRISPWLLRLFWLQLYVLKNYRHFTFKFYKFLPIIGKVASRVPINIYSWVHLDMVGILFQNFFLAYLVRKKNYLTNFLQIFLLLAINKACSDVIMCNERIGSVDNQTIINGLRICL